MPALERGDADYGVVIHEGRFVYQSHGLELISDLGERWEQRYRLPLPLGGIVGRHDLGTELLKKCDQVIRRSIHYGFAHRGETLSTMKRYAQELSDDVIWSHVDLYVNEMTKSLGDAGRRAIEELRSIAIDSGIVSADLSPLVFYRAC